MYRSKYLKYKTKYFELKTQIGGVLPGEAGPADELPGTDTDVEDIFSPDPPKIKHVVQTLDDSLKNGIKKQIDSHLDKSDEYKITTHKISAPIKIYKQITDVFNIMVMIIKTQILNKYKLIELHKIHTLMDLDRLDMNNMRIRNIVERRRGAIFKILKPEHFDMAIQYYNETLTKKIIDRTFIYDIIDTIDNIILDYTSDNIDIVHNVHNVHILLAVSILLYIKQQHDSGCKDTFDRFWKFFVAKCDNLTPYVLNRFYFGYGGKSIGWYIMIFNKNMIDCFKEYNIKYEPLAIPNTTNIFCNIIALQNIYGHSLDNAITDPLPTFFAKYMPDTKISEQYDYTGQGVIDVQHSTRKLMSSCNEGTNKYFTVEYFKIDVDQFFTRPKQSYPSSLATEAVGQIDINIGRRFATYDTGELVYVTKSISDIDKIKGIK